MTTYYKGSLVLRKNIKLKKIKFGSAYYEDKSEIKIMILNTKYKLTNKENDILINEFMKMGTNKESTDFNDIIFLILLSTKLDKKKEKEIIYEKIIDQNGNVYGKEILTGYIFPLLSNDDLSVTTNYHFNTLIDVGKVALSARTTYEIIDRNKDNLYKCYCIKNDIADLNEIEEYNNKNKFLYSPKFKFKEKIRRLYNMNVFDENIFNQNNNNSTNISNTNQSNNINNNPISISTTPSVNSLLNPPTISPSFLPENICNDIYGNSNNISSLFPTDIQLKWLEKLKIIINSLTEEDKNQLNDMTNNNLDNENVLKYILMSREERLEFLNMENKSKDENETEEKGKHKVSLKKVKKMRI